MNAASDQPGGADSVRPRNHQRSSARRSPSSAAAAHSGQSMHRSGEHASPQSAQRSRLTRPPGDGTDAAEPAEEHLEQLAVAKPGDGAEEHHPDEGEHGVSGHQRGDRRRDLRAGQDQLAPDSRREQRHRRPAGEPGRVGEAGIEALDAQPAREPLERAVGRAEGAERRPGVAGNGGGDRHGDPEPHPQEQGRERGDVRDDEADHDRAVPPQEAEDPQQAAQDGGEGIGDDDRPVVRIRRPAGDDDRDDERGGDRNGRGEQIEPQRDGQLECAADRVSRGGSRGRDRQPDGDEGGEREAPALSAHRR